MKIDFYALLDQLMQHGSDLGEVFYEDSQSLALTMDDNRMEQVVGGMDAGVGLRLVDRGRTAYTYGNDLSLEALLQLAKSLARHHSGATVKPMPLQSRSAKPAWVKQPPQQQALEEKLNLVRLVNQAARAESPHIRQVKVRYMEQVRQISIANSLGTLASEERTQLVMAVQCVAEKDGLLQTGYEVIGGSQGWEVFSSQDPLRAAAAAASRAARMLSARPAPSGSMPVVLAASAGGTMIHEAVGHGLEADLVWEKLSVYAGKLGQTVASPLISVVDDGTLPTWRGAASFDDEGAPTSRTMLIENGVLKTYLTDWLSSTRLGIAQSGNGRRESYRHQPICRMTNTMILPGEHLPEAIIAETKDGLLVTKMGGGQVNTVNGDFVFEVAEGYLLRDGKVGQAVRGATLVGNGPQVLMDIDRVGSDLGLAIGTCGKNGQGVPVGDAQPTLRIPQMVVGGQ